DVSVSGSGAEASSDRIERTLDVRGVETHLFEAGAAGAPPLLYLHGTFLGNLWLEAHRELARHFHLFAPDIPGFGLSVRPDWMRDMSDYVLYLRDLLDALGLEKPIIVGHSLGGWMAVEVAVWYPERVGRLILSNAAGIRVKGAPIADMFAMNPGELMAAVFDDFSAAAPLIPAEVTVDYILDQYRQRTTLASLAWNPHFDPKLERRLARVTCPTLVLWGANDRLIPPVYCETYARLIAGASLVTLPGTGHMPMFEQPHEWVRAIIEFAEASAGERKAASAPAAQAQR
ncbi:MAG TPA: alpha/beta hydrolase, partial [Ktedonobacterales bacterium]|nr:alpha/beta hydrolase [Ktedonobacterales bacterium]